MSFEHTFSENAEFYSFFTYLILKLSVSGMESHFPEQRTWSRSDHSRALSTLVGNPPVLAPAANNHISVKWWFRSRLLWWRCEDGWPRSTENILTTNTTPGAQMGLRGELEGMGFNDTALSPCEPCME